jgi:aconitase B
VLSHINVCSTCCLLLFVFPTTAKPSLSVTVTPKQDSVKEYLTSNVTMLKWMIAEGYGDKRTIARRIAKVRVWFLCL